MSDLPPIQVAVLGPGGIGGLLAALLARRGDRVTCLAPPATAAHLAEHGLELRSPTLGDAKVAVEAATRLDQPVDVVFVTVKATQLEAAVEAVPAEVLSGGLVVPFLNGIDHMAWLRERYPAGQVVAGTTRIESTRVGPGLIEHASPFAVVELAVADPSRREQVEALGARLAATGLDVTIRDDEAATLAILERVPDAMRSSMQKDAAAGRPIELDAIGGAVLLIPAVIIGRVALAGANPGTLAFPLSFAGGAVLAALADTLMPEAFERGRPLNAFATCVGFFVAFVLAES